MRGTQDVPGKRRAQEHQWPDDERGPFPQQPPPHRRTDRHRQSGDEYRRVAALRKRDDYRILRVIGVIFAKLVAQPPGIHAYDRIHDAVEIGAFFVKLRAKDLLFEAVTAAIKSLLH